MLYRKLLLIVGIVSALGLLLWIYYQYNPLDSIFFPKCPIKSATGLDCPGCGSQRALHYLLKGDIKQSFFQNPLLYVLVPYVGLGIYLHDDRLSSLEALKWRKYLYGYNAIWTLMIVIILFTVVRNII